MQHQDQEPMTQQDSEKPAEGDAQDIDQDLGETESVQPRHDAEPGTQQSSEKPAEGE